MAISRVLFILIFSVAQLASGGSAFGLVFCIGEDGHAGIELTHDVCGEHAPTESHTHSEHAPVELVTPGSSCIDINLWTGAVTAVGRSLDRDLATSLLHLPLLVGFDVPPVLERQRFKESRSTPFDTACSLTSLRTVVLTI